MNAFFIISILVLSEFLASRMKHAWVIRSEHRLATILHPKLRNFDMCNDEKDNALAELKLALDKYRLNISAQSVHLVNSNQVISSSSSNTDTYITTLKSKNILTQCFDTTLNSNSKTPNPYQEIDDYLNSDLPYDYNKNSCEDGDIDVLLYWKEKQHQFSSLSAIAKQIYAIPASNTVIERLFSAAKNTVDHKRTNLGSERINQLLFLQKNFSVLKQLFHEKGRKRTVSMTSTTTTSSEDSLCTMSKQSRTDDEDNYNNSDDIEMFLD